MKRLKFYLYVFRAENCTQSSFSCSTLCNKFSTELIQVPHHTRSPSSLSFTVCCSSCLLFFVSSVRKVGLQLPWNRLVSWLLSSKTVPNVKIHLFGGPSPRLSLEDIPLEILCWAPLYWWQEHPYISYCWYFVTLGKRSTLPELSSGTTNCSSSL